MEKKLSNKQMMAWRLFLQTHSLMMATLGGELEREQSLSLPWWDVLVHLNHVPGSQLRLHELAQSLFLTRSGVTRLLDRMEENGFVRRERCLEDRRGVYAIITPKGKAALQRATPGHIRGINTHFMRHLDESDVEALCSVFPKILQGEASLHEVLKAHSL